MKKVVAQVLKTEEAKVVPEAHFVRDLGAESIQSIELVAAFEEEFDIEMDPDEALSVQSVDNAIDFIANVIDAQHG